MKQNIKNLNSTWLTGWVIARLMARRLNPPREETEAEVEQRTREVSLLCTLLLRSVGPSVFVGAQGGTKTGARICPDKHARAPQLLASHHPSPVTIMYHVR